MPLFYDTHAHLDDGCFAKELPELVERAAAAGIGRIVTIGTDLESSQAALKLSERFPSVFAAVGWHPSHALEAPDDFRPVLRELAAHPKAVALGETGLDYYWLPSKKSGGSLADDERLKAKQAALFDQHLEVAAELGLNCVIHQRDSFEDTLARLRPYAERVRGVFHCFSGDESAMRRVLELGSIVSFTGIVTFKNAQTIRDTLAAAPLGRFMLETDSPYMAPVPYRGQRCEPAYVKEIAATAAQVRGCSLAELSEGTCAAAHDFFKRFAPS